jgi:hypothetical protein
MEHLLIRNQQVVGSNPTGGSKETPRNQAFKEREKKHH